MHILTNTDFIVFSDDWGRHPFSCQHIMKHFLPGNRLLWVNTIGMRTPRLSLYDIKRSFEKVASWIRPNASASPEPLPHNLRILSPVMIPYNTISAVRFFNRESVVRSVQKAMRDWGFTKPVLLTTQPLASDYVGRFGERLVVYYCVDDFTVWPGMNQPELVRGMEDSLLARSDLVTAVSDSLCASRSNGRTPTRLLTHGVDVEHFRQAAQPLPRPEALRGLGGPIIGFFGLIDSHFDRELTAALLDARPGWQIVCIGTRRIDLGELEKRPNFHWLPPVPYAELPSYAAAFDVAVIPYKVNEHTQTASPLKLREYIATGKPVVTTPMADVFRFQNHIAIAGTDREFIAAIEKALASPPVPEAQEQALAGESWKDKAALLSSWIEEGLEQRPAGERKDS